MELPLRYILLPDTHLGHEKMTKYCGRPTDFESIILMNMMEMMAPSDVLVHLGDVTVGWSVDRVKDYFDKIDCASKILVLGNHDKSWSVTKWLKVFDAVCDSIIIKSTLLSHRPSNLGIKNIHGHTHNNGKPGWINGKYKLALEDNKYKPFLLESLL